MTSNGWTDRTAALQLFAHLEGQALNIALLMPEGERANWECLSQGLSDYYNSPGRLAVFRRRFESTTRRPEMDPATFATELQTLAVRGFGDMGKRARDKFIVAQWNRGFRRHLDGVPPDTPIRDIVDRCRVWESHSEQTESGQGVDLDQDPPEGPGVLRKTGGLREKSKERTVTPVVDPRVPVPVASVILTDDGSQLKVGNGDSQLAPLEVISSLVTRLLQTAQEGRLADAKIPPEEGVGSSSAVLAAERTERGHSTREWVRVCFSCERPGHGVNRCSQVDTSFPFLLPGWSVDVRDGQYRAVRTGGTGRWSAPGNEGWSGWEDQPPGSLGTKVRLTPAGEMVDQGEAGRHGSCRWGGGLATAGHRACMLFRHFNQPILSGTREPPTQQHPLQWPPLPQARAAGPPSERPGAYYCHTCGPAEHLQLGIEHACFSATGEPSH